MGAETPKKKLQRAIGSCRDSAWLLVAAARELGLAARFVSGYLVQLASDVPSLDGPSGPEEDFTDLHAWAEVYVPGAGWIGLDPTSALFAGEGHIPLAATPHPVGSAPITGATGPCDVEFSFSNVVRRYREDPRVTKPYTPEQVGRMDALGDVVDARLSRAGVELTMGGEPTFVSIDDFTADEWTTAADGEQKRERAGVLADALFEEFAPGGVVQHSQGKWYPGESLPRWQIAMTWRVDGEALWGDPGLLDDPGADPRPDARAEARRLALTLVESLGLPASQAMPCVEDALASLADDLARPAGPRPAEPEVSAVGARERDDAEEPVAWAIPLSPGWWGDDNAWASPLWRLRRGRLVLIPGDSPAGQRLPLRSLAWKDPEGAADVPYLVAGDPLPTRVGPVQARMVDIDQAPTRTSVVIQDRGGHVRVFLPPVEEVERFQQLLALVERVAQSAGVPVVLEGYGPPPDPRLRTFSVTPDPGVIEVNVPPAADWPSLRDQTRRLYDIARLARLGTERFGVDGRHSGTGGGNHITLGGPEPSRSPMLLRPDLLVSMITYWQHHPSLSYLFSGRFVGPTSQAPRVDEGRPEALYELEVAFSEIERLGGDRPRPWLADRALRGLLTDITGNTHRAEFCIDKLYDPDTNSRRLGLLELRGFEMPPHADMGLVQALLVRALVARFAEVPYNAPLVRWGTTLHERFLLPHFVMTDVADVVADLRAHGFEMELAWFDPFLEFRFPRLGTVRVDDVEMELRWAIEPWHVLGEEATEGGTARFVDSSVERLQVLTRGLDPDRHLVTCNGQPVPLAPTATPGEHVAGVRYKAWKPHSSLHPTTEVDAPLRFDVVDRARRLSLGGATYHVSHPGGRSYDDPPVNAVEAEARRSRRFEAMGHTMGLIDVEALEERMHWRRAGSQDFPLLLDLRHRRPRRWGRG